MNQVRGPQFVLEQTKGIESAFRNVARDYSFNRESLDNWTRMGLLFHKKIGETGESKIFYVNPLG
jgi:hypothetical protein